jgi:hypothetical protein
VISLPLHDGAPSLVSPPPPSSLSHTQNICVFRIIEAFQGSSMSDVLGSIVPGPQPKVVLPRVIQGRKVLYRVSSGSRVRGVPIIPRLLLRGWRHSPLGSPVVHGGWLA